MSSHPFSKFLSLSCRNTQTVGETHQGRKSVPPTMVLCLPWLINIQQPRGQDKLIKTQISVVTLDFYLHRKHFSDRPTGKKYTRQPHRRLQSDFELVGQRKLYSVLSLRKPEFFFHFSVPPNKFHPLQAFMHPPSIYRTRKYRSHTTNLHLLAINAWQ